MAGHEKALNFDAVNLESLAVMQQHLFVVNCDLRQFIEMIYDFSPHLAGEIPVFNLADIELVSYTHLDVYKRQESRSSAPHWCAWQ